MAWIADRRRARRYPIATSLVFREPGESEWCRASTMNVSHSGVLFRTDGPLPGTGSAVQFDLTLPRSGVAPAVHVRGTGHVVRIATEEVAGGCAAAMAIDSYAFEVGATGRP